MRVLIPVERQIQKEKPSKLVLRGGDLLEAAQRQKDFLARASPLEQQHEHAKQRDGEKNRRERLMGDASEGSATQEVEETLESEDALAVDVAAAEQKQLGERVAGEVCVLAVVVEAGIDVDLSGIGSGENVAVEMKTRLR